MPMQHHSSTYAVLLGKTKITLTEPHLCWKNNLEKRYIALMFPVKRSKIRGVSNMGIPFLFYAYV